MRRSFYLSLIALLCLALTGLAQESAFVPDLKQMVSVPASPEASAFAKYGNTPVSQYTGTPGISVPLANIAGRSASLPVALTYDASGIKVEQIASWVGLGWNLNVGGAITRTINGLPDDYLDANPKYFPYYSDKSPTWGDSIMSYYVDYFRTNDMGAVSHSEAIVDDYKDFLDDFKDGLVDTQPDSYSFSAMGISGTIYIDYSDATAVCLEHPEYKVVPSLGTSSTDNKGSRQLDSWVITDNQGNQYTFDKPEKTELIDLDQQDDEFRDYYSAWYLTEFKSTNGKDVFDFHYNTTATAYTNSQQLAGTESMPLGGGTATSYDPKIKRLQHELDSVSINDIKRLQFVTATRSDLTGKKHIDSVKVFDRSGASQNVIDLVTSYFDDGNTPLTEYNQRLKLDSVKILGADAAADGSPELVKAYAFTYIGDDFVPSRLSLGQDFWGYYNGVGTNTHLRPHISSTTTYDGANRVPNIVSSTNGTLQKITYPTGGTTEFFYQQNHIPNPDPEGIPNILATGGFRVYKIEDRPDTNSVAQTRYFYYGELQKTDEPGVDDLSDLDDDFFKNSTATSGILQVPADFLHQTSTKTYDGTNWVDGTSTTVLASTRYRGRSSLVTYSTVTELKMSGTETNGFTVYKFNNLANYDVSLSTTRAPLNGRLSSTDIYDDNLNLIQNKSLTYGTIGVTSKQGYKLESTIFQDYDGFKRNSGSNYYVNYEQMTTLGGGPPHVQVCGSCLLPGPTNKYAPTTFNLQVSWIRLLSETSTAYEASGALTTTTEYTYDAWDAQNPDDTDFVIVSTETKDDDQVVYTGFTYPQDLSASGNIYEDMVDANRTGQVVKTITKRGGASGLTLQEQETTFAGSAASQLPDSVKYATNGGPLETRIVYADHDLKGNPTSLIKDDYQNIQYLWDWDDALPTAMITGVLDGSDERKYAYSSFETDEKGNWTYSGTPAALAGAPSGAKVYNLNGGSVTRNSLDTDETYLLSFWAKGTGTVKIEQKLSGVATNILQAVTAGWVYYEIEVSSLDQLVISENAGGDSIDLDELRLYARTSQMTTYAYDAAGRLITQTGPNGIPIHYEYDMHGRLIRVTDFEGNTLRLMEYEYQNTTGN